jgi:predicted outer membrane repeat protein
MVPSFFYRCTFDKNSAGWDGGAIFCNMGFMTSKATAYGCTFTNNYADDHGGAVFVDSACEFEFYSDEESGKPGIMKSNTAGIKGGGIYAETSSFARVALGGEIYIKNNTSLGGDDDLYITDGSYVTVYNITSPKGSIGLRVKNSIVKVAAQFDATVTSPDVKPFFANNKSFELTLGTTRSNTSVGDVNCINMTKASGIASIISEGSPAVIISLAVFALAFAVIVAVVIVKKKKADLATSAEDKDEK